MKILKTSSVLFGLLAMLLASVFMVSCEQEIHVIEEDIVSVNPTAQISAQQEEVREIITSNKYSEDCLQTYYIAYNERLTNAEEARAYFGNLSLEEQTNYLDNASDATTTRSTCGPWELLDCGFEPDCFFDTGGILPYKTVVARDCHHGLYITSYCWCEC